MSLKVQATLPTSGDVEAKYVVKPHGFTFTQILTTSNILKTQLELATALTPDTGAKYALFTTTYKQPGLHTRAFLDIFKVCVAYGMT